MPVLQPDSLVLLLEFEEGCWGLALSIQWHPKVGDVTEMYPAIAVT